MSKLGTFLKEKKEEEEMKKKKDVLNCSTENLSKTLRYQGLSFIRIFINVQLPEC